jgi:hypothetical protein
MDVCASQSTRTSYDAFQQSSSSRLLRLHHLARKTVAEACQEICSNLQITKRKFALGVMCAIWALGLLVALAFLLLFGLLPSLSLDSEHPSACHPDGTFSPFGQTYNPWATSGFFQINLAFGNLTFTNVKIIDIVWDIVSRHYHFQSMLPLTYAMSQVIGRGGQALMAIVSWRVFADYIATSIVRAPITYLTFRVVFLETGPSLASVCRLARDLLARRGLDSKLLLYSSYGVCFSHWDGQPLLALPLVIVPLQNLLS